MKLQARSSRDLSVALGKSAKCIVSKNTIAILDNVLLWQDEEGNFFFTSATSDAQLTISAPITIVEGKFDTPIALPIKTITPFLNTLPDCTITFNFVSEHKLTLEYCTSIGDKTKSGQASFTYFSGNEFPRMAKPAKDGLHIKFPGNVVQGAIEKSRNFISNNELRPVMCALCVDVVDDLSEAVFVATTGHVLYKQIVSNDPAQGGVEFYQSGSPDKILIHSQYFRPITVFAGAEQVDIMNDGHSICLAADNMELICKAIEARYPNYNAVIPRGNPYHICFDKQEMLSVIRRVSMFSSSASNMIVLEKDGLFVKISAQDEDFGTSAADEVVIISADCPDHFKIGFKASSLADVINTIDGTTIRLSLSDPTHAGVVTEDNPSPRVTTLVMPLLIND